MKGKETPRTLEDCGLQSWLNTLDEQETRIALDDLEFMHGSHGPRFSRHVAFYTDTDDGRLVTSWFWYDDTEDTVMLRAKGGHVVFNPTSWNRLHDMLERSLDSWRHRREAEAWAKSLARAEASSILDVLDLLDCGIRRGFLGDKISFAVSVSDDGCRMVDVVAGGKLRFKVAFELLREYLMEYLYGPEPDEDKCPGASYEDHATQKPKSRVFDAGVVPC